MATVIRSPEAELDVIEIASYIARDNLDAALRLLDIFDEKLTLIAESPMIGRVRHDLAPALRSFAVGNYILFYRPISDGIELARVLHGARDLRRLFASHGS